MMQPPLSVVALPVLLTSPLGFATPLAQRIVKLLADADKIKKQSVRCSWPITPSPVDVRPSTAGPVLSLSPVSTSPLPPAVGQTPSSRPTVARLARQSTMKQSLKDTRERWSSSFNRVVTAVQMSKVMSVSRRPASSPAYSSMAALRSSVAAALPPAWARQAEAAQQNPGTLPAGAVRAGERARTHRESLTLQRQAVEAANPSIYSADAKEAEAMQASAASERMGLLLQVMRALPQEEEVDRQMMLAWFELRQRRAFLSSPDTTQRPASSRLPRLDLNSSEAASWRSSKSIFASRIAHGETKSMFDTDVAVTNQLATDWARFVRKTTFTRLVSDAAGAVEGKDVALLGGRDVTAALTGLCEAMAERRNALRALFHFYIAASAPLAPGTPDPGLVLALDGWRRMLVDCRLVDFGDPDSSLAPAACDHIFFSCATDGEEELPPFGKHDESTCLARFEFLEALVRLSLTKYVGRHLERESDASQLHRLARSGGFDDLLPSTPSVFFESFKSTLSSIHRQQQLGGGSDSLLTPMPSVCLEVLPPSWEKYAIEQREADAAAETSAAAAAEAASPAHPGTPPPEPSPPAAPQAPAAAAAPPPPRPPDSAFAHPSPSRVSLAFTTLLDCDILPRLAPSVLAVPDDFRKDHLYTPDVEVALAPHLNWLRALYDQAAAATSARPSYGRGRHRRSASALGTPGCYSSVPATPLSTTTAAATANRGAGIAFSSAAAVHLLGLDEWMGLLHGSGLAGASCGASGLDELTCRVVFFQSLKLVVDELGRRSRSGAMTWEDFLEGLVRLAARLDPPPRDFLRELFRRVLNVGRLEMAAAEEWGYLTFYTKVVSRRAEEEGGYTFLCLGGFCTLYSKRGTI